MTNDLFKPAPGATPPREDEKRYLRVPVTTRKQLDALEAANVASGRKWALASRKDCLTPEYLCELHRRMFGDVYVKEYAGTYRQHEVNIGKTPYYEVPVAITQALDEARAWRDLKSFDTTEIAVRLHHRLVLIHPFAGGNGRCTRMMADVLIKRLGGEPLTWGKQSLIKTGPARDAYRAALQAADDHNYGPLIAFATS